MIVEIMKIVIVFGLQTMVGENGHLLIPADIGVDKTVCSRLSVPRYRRKLGAIDLKFEW